MPEELARTGSIPDLQPPSDLDAEHRLRDEAQARLGAIVESSDDAIVSKTLDGIIRTWNAGAERIFGYTADEIIGKPILTLLPKDRQDEERQILSRLQRGERVDHFETVRVHKDGRLIDISVTISPIRDSTGRVVGASKVARDITSQKQIQAELHAAKEQAESANRAKDHFLGVLSHELRTPLTPVLGALGFLKGRLDLPPEVREELEMIERNVAIEARLVDDLLDLTRISRGKIQLHFETVDAHQSLRSALQTLQSELDAKELTLSQSLQARPHHVWADPARLQQVFLNLISNAIKFTPRGGSISLRSKSVYAGRVQITIADTGIGITEELMTRLFSPFEQGEQDMAHRVQGLGLGLSITRSLIEMHGGEIRAQSDGTDRGATFEIILDGLCAGRTATQEASNGEATVNTRVLLVEDHSDTRRVMSKLLRSFGCLVHTAGTVAEALAIAENECFDLLVSDIGLPDGSGMDIMRQIRTRQNIKGIALSGFGQPEDLRRSQEAGFDLHLTKPIDFRSLQKVIEKVTR